jgi:hypothetical protein
MQVASNVVGKVEFLSNTDVEFDYRYRHATFPDLDRAASGHRYTAESSWRDEKLSDEWVASPAVWYRALCGLRAVSFHPSRRSGKGGRNLSTHTVSSYRTLQTRTSEVEDNVEGSNFRTVGDTEQTAPIFLAFFALLSHFERRARRQTFPRKSSLQNLAGEGDSAGAGTVLGLLDLLPAGLD